eukprot:CAMPEP_0118956250 /NCGR_PEP_ID=MMETSP1169-20130426/61390_1 /TAXON_ID=36882 /ORGANISM="Pyramimonas obovata, Strain CCMP722" /LENGTH=47 /DNA_ID= /DNA_START= /DNA_END= /DNA_ORIENTATION=
MKVNGMSSCLTVAIALVLLAQPALSNEDLPVSHELPDLTKLISGASG